MNKISVWPFGDHRRITSVVGPRTYMYKGEEVSDFHKGWDVGLEEGIEFRSPENGNKYYGWDKAFGNYVVLKGQFYRWNFWHLQNSSMYEFESGDTSKEGYLGRTGNSGTSTAPHCHMQIALAGSASGEYVDPFEVFTQEIIDSLAFPVGTRIPIDEGVEELICSPTFDPEVILQLDSAIETLKLVRSLCGGDNV